MKKSLKEKILSLVAVCAMAISLLALPVSVAAEEVMTQEAFETALKSGGVIDLGGKTVTLDSYLVINNNVTIKDGTFVPGAALSKSGVSNPNLITLSTGADVKLDNVTIKTNDQVKYALHVYLGTLEANNLTVDHSNAYSGGAILINNNSKATFTGDLNVTIGANSWYGINVDKNSVADFTGAKLNVAGTVVGTKSAVCIDNPSESCLAKGLNLTVVETEKTEKQVSYVADENLEQFIAAKTNEGADITKVTLNKDVVLKNPLTLAEAMVFDGNGHKLTVKSSDTTRADNNAVNVTANGVELKDLTIVTTDTVKSGLHVYKVKTTAENLTVDNTNTLGGACIVVNSGDLTLSGATTFKMGEKSWGGINVDDKYGQATLTFAEDSKLVSTDSKAVVYADVKDSNNPEIKLNGLEEVGLLENEDGSFATTIDLKMIGVLDGHSGEAIVIPIPYGSSLTDEDIKALEDMAANGEFDIEGTVFKGFFLDMDGKTKLEANKVYEDDLTIYMIWETQKVDEPDKPSIEITPNPSETKDPSKPTTPTETTKPVETPEKGEKVETGDNSGIALYGSICALAVVGAGIVVLKKKREELLNK